MEPNDSEILVAGGGAAGLLAALRAAECGCAVRVLERMDHPGRKLAITGKGRGNLTTAHDVKTAVAAFGAGGNFLRGAFSRFYNTDLIALMESLGVPLAEERGRRVFPVSHRAKDVVDILIAKLNSLGVRIETGARVKHIVAEENRVTGAVTSLGLIPADRIILATGGASYSGTGSTGDGYQLAGTLGHSVISPSPALVPIELGSGIPRELNALSLRLVNVALELDGRIIQQEFNDMLFTPYGVTGPAALTLGKAVAQRAGQKGLTLIVNFKPALSREQVSARLQRDFAAEGRKSLKEIMAGVLPRRAVPVILRCAGVSPDVTGNQVTREQREALVEQLTAFRLPVRGVRPLDEAIVTAGGVALNEVNPRTMESRLVSGLYLCGELLDLDACTGGFNLQAAFSTGWVAGESACGARRA